MSRQCRHGRGSLITQRCSGCGYCRHTEEEWLEIYEKRLNEETEKRFRMWQDNFIKIHFNELIPEPICNFILCGRRLAVKVPRLSIW